MPNTAFRRFARRSSVKDTFDLLSGMHDDSHDADSHVFQDPIIPRRRRPLAQPVKVTYLQAKREKRKRTLEEQRAASDSSSEQEGSDKNRKDDDDDDDFQSSSRLRRHRTSANATPSKRSKRSTRAKNETIASPPSPVPKLNLPRKSARMSTSLAEKQEQKKELERKREALEKTGFSSKQATHANGRNQGFVCPFCHEELGLPLPYKVDRALNLIKAKDREFANQSAIAAGESVNNASFRARHIQYKRPVDDREEERFCRLHRIELKIKPQGRRKGYPLHIAFEDLEERIQGFRQELMDVIAGRVHSSYRETALKAYKDLGTNKARSVMGVMARFETTLPGYYGSKGAAIILDILNSMFLQTGLLGKEQTSPQLPMEYLQQVLVPEVGYRLIRQDIINHSKHTPQDLTSDETEMSLAERAKIIMSESSEFGSLIHPGADDQDEVLDISDDSQNEEKDTNNIANHSDDGSLDPNASDRSDDPDHESQTVISCSEDEEKDSEDDSTNDERTEDDNASPSELDRLENIPTVAPPPNKKPSVLIISDSSSDDEP